MNLNEKRKWAENAVVYQIYPRSFKDSNGDGVGDLKGIIDRLDYLNDGTSKSLGIDAIWLSPIYKSPMKDFGYDISDYKDIYPVFGTLKDFDKLVKEAHKRRIKIVMDFVPNHTSSVHPWFLESRSSKNNSKRDWYIWKDGKDGSPPNNWHSVFGGSAWEFDKKTGQYYLHSFLKEQPDLNWRSDEVRNEMYKVLEFWLHKGVDGFRSDAIYHLIKDSQFRDDPPNPNYDPSRDDPGDSLLHIYSRGQTETLDQINTFCKILGKHQDRFMVSEAYLDIPEMTKMYKSCRTHPLHAPFNFNLMSLKWDATSYKKFVDDFEKSLRINDLPNYVLGNHDRSRIASRLGQKRARLAALIQLTLRGMPFIYYGEEIGMEDIPIPPSRIQDPVGRDKERTPMQWDNEKFAEFSSVSPWLPVGENYKKVNVNAELKDQDSMLNLYRCLIHYRRKSDALMNGEVKTLDLKNKNVFAFLRQSEKEKVLVVLNFSNKIQEVFLSFKKGKVICSTHTNEKLGEMVDLKKLQLMGYEGTVFTL